MFSNLSLSSISLATVTPSLVIRGAPHDLSMTTLRPLGPRVTRTALARMSTPRNIRSRASVENFTSLAAMDIHSVLWRWRLRKGERAASGEDAHDVRLLHDQELFTVELDFGARPLAEQHPVAGLEVERNQLAGLVARTGANGNDLALLRLLLGGVRDDDAAGRLLLGGDAANHDTVVQRTEIELSHIFLVGAVSAGSGWDRERRSEKLLALCKGECQSWRGNMALSLDCQVRACAFRSCALDCGPAKSPPGGIIEEAWMIGSSAHSAARA